MVALNSIPSIGVSASAASTVSRAATSAAIPNSHAAAPAAPTGLGAPQFQSPGCPPFAHHSLRQRSVPLWVHQGAALLQQNWETVAAVAIASATAVALQQLSLDDALPIPTIQAGFGAWIVRLLGAQTAPAAVSPKPRTPAAPINGAGSEPSQTFAVDLSRVVPAASPLAWPTQIQPNRVDVQVPDHGRLEFVVGRDAINPVHFTDNPVVSRQHARIAVVASAREVTVKDLGSTNGTYIQIGESPFIRVLGEMDYLAQADRVTIRLGGDDRGARVVLNFGEREVTPPPAPVSKPVAALVHIPPVRGIPLPVAVRSGRDVAADILHALKGRSALLPHVTSAEGSSPIAMASFMNNFGGGLSVTIPAAMNAAVIPEVMSRIGRMQLPRPVQGTPPKLHVDVVFVPRDEFDDRITLHRVQGAAASIVAESGLIRVTGTKNEGKTMAQTSFNANAQGVVGNITGDDIRASTEHPIRVTILIPVDPRSSSDRVLTQLNQALARAAQTLNINHGDSTLILQLLAVFQ